MRDSLEMFPVTVVTGFLGSGKTTLLNHLVRQPGLARTLVLINEFGEIGLDHDLMSRGSDDAVYVEMASGCLCCTIRGDLVRTLHEAPGRFARGGEVWFDRVVIETTGLADPAPILHTLIAEPKVTQRYQLDGVVTVVDALNGLDTLNRHPESVKQVAMADRLVLSKTDLVDAQGFEAIAEGLSTINPGAAMECATQSRLEPGRLLGLGLYEPGSQSVDAKRWLQAEALENAEHHDHGHHHQDNHHDHGDHHHDVNRHSVSIRAFCVTRDEPLPLTAMETGLDTLRATLGSGLLRVKGLLNIAGHTTPVVIHGVQHVLHAVDVLDAWPGEDRRTRIVFITDGIPRERIEGMLNAFIGSKPP